MSSTARNWSLVSGGRAAPLAFCRACVTFLAPGITVVTPGCWMIHRNATWAGAVPPGASAAALPPLTSDQLRSIEDIYDRRIRAQVHLRW